MAYTDHFKLADDMIGHLNSVMNSIQDPFISSRYVGFVAVAAVTVYELSIKEIFISFAEKKHKVLGNFTANFFDRINGRIKIQNIKDDYIKKFGDKYVRRFTSKLDAAEARYFQDYSISLKNCYSNIIVWRNGFAHEGTLPNMATYREVTKSYEVGKNIIVILDDTMTR